MMYSGLSALQHHQIAGKPLKLDLPTAHGNIVRGRGNDLGYGKNDQDANNGQSAAKLLTVLFVPMKKVQRLDGDGFSRTAGRLKV